MHGFVYADEEPHGVYFVEWCEGQHELRIAFMTISFGRYGDEEATGRIGMRSASRAAATAWRH